MRVRGVPVYLCMMLDTGESQPQASVFPNRGINGSEFTHLFDLRRRFSVKLVKDYPDALVENVSSIAFNLLLCRPAIVS